MKYLITGGAGFIGSKSFNRSFLVRQLIEENVSIERMVDVYSECWNEVMDKVEHRA